MRNAALFPSPCISLFAVENKFNVCHHHQITSKSECAGLSLKLKLRSITLYFVVLIGSYLFKYITQVIYVEVPFN